MIRTYAPWLLEYKTPKYIKVDVPQVAVLFRICQGLALCLSLLPLYFNDAWALSETPGGVVNAWSTQGGMPSSTQLELTNLSAPYCQSGYGAASRTAIGARAETDDWSGAPTCRLLRASELTRKTANSIAFTSALVETRTTGWRCVDDDANRTRWAACSARGGVPFQRQTGQCGCQVQQTIHPFAMERMSMRFEHAYVVEGGWQGSSALVDGDEGEEGLWSDVVYGNGTRRRFGAGQVLDMPVGAWLAAANLSLDEATVPPQQQPGAADDDVVVDSSAEGAPLRVTGASLRVDISYTNIDPYSRRAVIGKRSVHADVRVSTVYATVVEVNRERVWIGPESLPDGPPTEFDYIERQSRGIVFQFHVSGQVYAFDWFVMLEVLLSAVVLIQVANIAADAVSFYCLPNGQSTVLRNKRQESVSKKSEFAEMGMRAALAALRYRGFDPDNNGSIEPVDICKAFAHVEKADGTPWVPWEMAHAIAHNVLADADTDADDAAAGGQYGLSFTEFVTCLYGESINFDEFLKALEPPKNATDAEECRLAYEEERAKLPPVSKPGARPGGGRRPELPPPIKSDAKSDGEKQSRLDRRGELKLHVLCADGLKSADKNGLADPYVSVQLGKQEQKSSSIPKTLQPIWDESLGPWKVRALGKVLPQQMKLVIRDKDEGMLRRPWDEVIGEVNVSLEALAEYERANFTERVSPQGTLVFSISWVETADGEGVDSPSPEKKKKKKKEDTVNAADESTTATSSTHDVPPPVETPESTEPVKKKKKKTKEKAAEEEQSLIGAQSPN